jgi:hypothetical protein
VEPYRVGVPPLTPGDASFRTTIAEAPPALASPFLLTYSLGEIVQLAPPADGAGGFVAAAGGLDGADGFVPAAGGLDDRAPVAAACGGAINRGVAPDGCARQTVTESYWATTAESR